MTTALDVETDVNRLYRARPTPELVDVPKLTFLMIDGRGDPNSSERFREAVQALYGASYTMKFALKRASGLEFRVGPLEALWWNTGTTADKSEWKWTAMIRQPAEVTADLVEWTSLEVAEKKRLPAARELRLETFAEGLAAQILHIGPYGAEEPTIERLSAFIAEQGYAMRGKHHEIYLSDPRRAAPERLKTIIRHPVALRA